jgi:hypothetical protein
VLQFIPSWNACTMPVTTPTATLIRKRWPKKPVIFSYAPPRLPRKNANVFITAISMAMLTVSDTKKKAKMLVEATGNETDRQRPCRVLPRPGLVDRQLFRPSGRVQPRVSSSAITPTKWSTSASVVSQAVIQRTSRRLRSQS